MPAAAFSEKHPFSAWPNPKIPPICAGVYAIWEEEQLVYCGMSGRGIDAAVKTGKTRYGLVTRLNSHANGRLSGDQFCVYVANRLVIPLLAQEQLSLFGDGRLTLDRLTKEYITRNFTYQYVIVQSSSAAYDLEMSCRRGEVFGAKPLLNPG